MEKKFNDTIFQLDGEINEIHKILLNENSIPKQNLTKIKLNNNNIIAFLKPIRGDC